MGAGGFSYTVIMSGGVVAETVLVVADVSILLVDETLERSRSATRSVGHDELCECMRYRKKSVFGMVAAWTSALTLWLSPRL
jgi:hypothetical protein